MNKYCCADSGEAVAAENNLSPPDRTADLQSEQVSWLAVFRIGWF